jgi:HNH endonuclease
MGAHRAEWIEKRGPIPPGMMVCHHCDNPPCREIAHLFLGTNRDNLGDMASKGRSTWGTRNNTTKLTPAQVDEIRLALAAGEKQRDIGGRYGVCKSTIGCIARSESWRHWPERVEG